MNMGWYMVLACESYPCVEKVMHFLDLAPPMYICVIHNDSPNTYRFAIVDLSTNKLSKLSICKLEDDKNGQTQSTIVKTDPPTHTRATLSRLTHCMQKVLHCAPRYTSLTCGIAAKDMSAIKAGLLCPKVPKAHATWAKFWGAKSLHCSRQACATALSTPSSAQKQHRDIKWPEGWNADGVRKRYRKSFHGRSHRSMRLRAER